jgi:3',5'-cyclic AMP phosphodiesterase CpdA
MRADFYLCENDFSNQLLYTTYYSVIRMKKIVHLSDLHFGKVDTKRIQPLLQHLTTINPDIVVISGDFTQRASEKEFKEAQAFIQKLTWPTFFVPGNHDLPLYNILQRIRSPYLHYKKYISTDLTPLYFDDEVALIGVNSTHRLTISSGRINKTQVEYIEGCIECLNPNIFKIVVSHHPFDLPTKLNTHHKYTHKVIGQSKMAMKRLAKHGVDMFLSGHFHVHHVSDTTMRYKIDGFSALIVQAGTAISTRSKLQPVSFNVLYIEPQQVTIDHYVGHPEKEHFTCENTETYHRIEKGWKQVF